MKCKYCNKEGIVKFGVITDEGWINEHLACHDHISLSCLNQKTITGLEEFKNRLKWFSSERKTLIMFPNEA